MRKALTIITVLSIALALQTALIHANDACDKAVIAYRIPGEDPIAKECVAFITLGYAHGIETGQTGDVVFKTKGGRALTTATLEVVDTDTYLSVFRLIGMTADEYMRDEDIQLECHEWSVRQRLEKAATAFEAEDWAKSQYFYATCRDSAPADQTDLICDRLDQCAQHVLEERNRKLSKEEKKKEKGKIQRYHELAIHYLLRGEYLAAQEYNDRILRVAKRHRAAKKTQKLIDRYAGAMLVTDEANKYAGCSTENGLPDVSDFVPVEVYPTMTYQCKVDYPKNAKRSGVEGTVAVQSLVSKNGKPIRSMIAESSGSEDIDYAALLASYGNRYKPGLQGGKPVAVWVIYRVDFVLD